ncbi:Glycosyltransferase Gtf1 [compost metagenome]
MVSLLSIENVSFLGHTNDIEALWCQHHALVLPSRSEGLPLSMVEAMAAGRIAVISRAGGNTELLVENETGFSGYPNEADFEEALERAWNRRDEWEAMGKSAALDIARRVPSSPENEFVAHVLSVVYDRQ